MPLKRFSKSDYLIPQDYTSHFEKQSFFEVNTVVISSTRDSKKVSRNNDFLMKNKQFSIHC
jgi:hypothetical protein